jgi:hypothetical protein
LTGAELGGTFVLPDARKRDGGVSVRARARAC